MVQPQSNPSASTSSASPHSFSIVGRNLKLDTAEDIQPILDDLNKVEDLKEVHFGGNTIGVEAAKALAAVLKDKKLLKIADFADIFTGRLITEIPTALRAICDALVDHTELEELNLSDNAFGGRSAEPMVNFLSNNHHFSVLRLNNNGLGIQGGTIVANALIQAAETLQKEGKQSSLRTVICGRNRLENGSAPVWAEAFAKHGGLREVRMFQNGIRMEGIQALSRGLSKCADLEVLDLQDNTATLKGSRAIALALPSWPKLTTLNLSDMLLKPKGGALILTALGKGHNASLQTLQLQYDDLDRRALDLLATAISAHLTKLEKLDINGNWADEEDDCIVEIKKALEKHGNEDALDEMDEMDPEGEEDEDGDESDEEEEEEEEEGEKEKDEQTTPENAPAGVSNIVSATATESTAETTESTENKNEASNEKKDDKALEAAAVGTATATAAAVPVAIATDASGEPSAKSAASLAPPSEPVTAVSVPATGFGAPADATTGETSNKRKSFAEVAAAAQSEAGQSLTEPSKPDQEAPVVAATNPTASLDADKTNDGSVTASLIQEAKTTSTEDVKQDQDADQLAEKLEKTDLGTSPSEAAVASASSSSEEPKIDTAAAAAAAPAPAAVPRAAAHAKSGSVDLSDELYTKEPAAKYAAPISSSNDTSSGSASQQARPSGSSNAQEDPARKKKGFKGAFGALKELLFK